MSDITCPHCGHREIPAQANGGGVVDCPHCGRVFLRPSQIHHEATAGELNPVLPHRVEPPGGSPTDVQLVRSAPIALVATLAFYVLLQSPLGDTYFGQLFSARGWVPYVIAYFSLWAIVILVFKFRLYREQLRVVTLDLLPLTLGREITPNNAHIFSSYLQHLSKMGPRSYLVERLDWGLRRFMHRRDAQELAQQLAERTRADADALDSSFSMLRVFVWAIPILGFIGTVLGISDAVGAFSYSVDNAASLEVMRDSIGSVTTGLGVAFDTTLLALVMSILIMFPMSSLQKAEEDLLAAGEQYCDDQLVGRLQDGGSSHPSQAMPLRDDRNEREELLAAVAQLERRIARMEPRSGGS